MPSAKHPKPPRRDPQPAPRVIVVPSTPDIPVSVGYTKFRSVFDKMGKPSTPVPTFPKKISTMTSEQLGDYTSQYAAWREFTEDMHFEALQDKMMLQGKYDFEHAKLMVTAQGGGLNEKKFVALADPILEPLRNQLLDADIYLDMVSSKLDSFNNSLAVLSREITRRGNAFNNAT